MLRRENTHSLHWTDKTMTMLRANQLEACEKELAGLPSLCLFDDECTDELAETFFEQSCYAREQHEPALHTIEGLRAMVLENFPAELALLSMEEHELVVKLCLAGGKLALRNWNDVAPAASLVRRLWCKASGRGEGMTLTMPNSLWLSTMLLLSGEAHQKAREMVEDVNATVEDSLYLLGATPIHAPIEHLCFLLQGTFLADQPAIATAMASRLIHSAYDYIITPDGQKLLIHPGFAEPDHLSPARFRDLGLYSMDSDALKAALESMDAIEEPLYLRMEGLLDGALRPEIVLEDAVQDLVLLAKQDVSMKDMEDVLGSQLIQQPTAEMLRALRDIHDLTPRWLSLRSSQVQ